MELTTIESYNWWIGINQENLIKILENIKVYLNNIYIIFLSYLPLPVVECEDLFKKIFKVLIKTVVSIKYMYNTMAILSTHNNLSCLKFIFLFCGSLEKF